MLENFNKDGQDQIYLKREAPINNSKQNDLEHNQDGSSEI